MAAKDAIIKRVYFDSGALGSIKRTLKEAREIDPSIKEKDVKSWKDRNIQRRINLRGYNSFIDTDIAPTEKDGYYLYGTNFLSSLKIGLFLLSSVLLIANICSSSLDAVIKDISKGTGRILD